MKTKLAHQNSYLIGVISDTHGRIPSDVPQAFRNVDLIIHAGDIGDQAVLNQLSKIAPVVAVRGNMDFGKWAEPLPETEIVEIGQIVLYVIHIANRLNVDPEKFGVKAIVSGHTHRPDIYEDNGISYINPGSASFPKAGQPGSVALIQIRETGLHFELLELKN